MKKSLLALAVADSLPAVAQAHSSFTLYGIADFAVGYTYISTANLTPAAGHGY